jgi:hypothetical protein
MPDDATVSVDEPAATPVTVNVALSCPWSTVAVAGTVATPVLLEDKLNVMPPAGAAADRLIVAVVVLVAFSEMVVGVSEEVTVTVTATVSGANPAALAVICADPIDAPVTCGFAAGSTAPAGTKTLGVTVATAVLVLAKLIVNPPVGAATERLTGRLAFCDGAKTGTVPKLMRLLVTVMGAVALVYPGALAVNTTLPPVPPADTANTAVV